MSNSLFTLSQRTVVTNFGVPSLRSDTANTVTGLDIMPNGSATADPVGGFAWIDVCSADCLSSTPGLQAARVAITATEAYVASISYGSALPFHVKVPKDNVGGLQSVTQWSSAVGLTYGVALGAGYTITAGDPLIKMNALGGSILLGAGYSLGLAATCGFVYMLNCAGTPTGTPVSYGTSVPMVYDTTGHKLWAYDGGAWKSTTFA